MKVFATAAAAALTLASSGSAMAQVTSAGQLRDVQPTEWSYQAVSNLVSRYGCVAGFPDGTFRPGEAATRAQLAALTNACLDRIEEFQTAADAQLAAALRAEFAKELGQTNARVAKLEAAAAAKANGIGNYIGLGVTLNRQGVGGAGKAANSTISGASLLGRYGVKQYSNGNAVSVRPYINAAAGPNGQIGAGGGALLSYDWSIAKRGGVSAANVYAGAGYQIPFVNGTQSNFQSSVGGGGQAVLALGIEGRVTKSLVGFADLKFPTTNAGVQGSSYSPVFTTGLGIKF